MGRPGFGRDRQLRPTGAPLAAESFTADTMVLLPNGKAVPISKLKPGDKVLATDTKTGKDQAETVTAVLVHHDTDLYDLTVKTGHSTEVIHTTSSHLFWDPLHKAGSRQRHLTGHALRPPAASHAASSAASPPAVHDGWMWDLTVPGNNDHDFYVVAGTSIQADSNHGIMLLLVERQSWCMTVIASQRSRRISIRII